MENIQSISKPHADIHRSHLVVLDGLRGLASLCVVIFHFSETVIPDYRKLWIGHGFLAVDFFFCLSGFVHGYAYSNRIPMVGLSKFLKIRLVRLQPMVLFGAILGAATFYANPFGVTPGYSYSKIASIFVTSILLIPDSAMPERSRTLFSLNAPSWSLLWEYFASFVFGIVLYRIRCRVLFVASATAAVALGWAGHHAGTQSGGWGAGNFWYGGARVAYSFSTGLLIYRAGWRLHSGFGLFSISLLLMLAFMMPYPNHAWLWETVIIVVYFPMLVTLGASADVTWRKARFCRIFGELSYPLYMTHYAVIWIWADYAQKFKLASRNPWPAIAFGVVGTVAFAWMVLKCYDQPIRRYLGPRS